MKNKTLGVFTLWMNFNTQCLARLDRPFQELLLNSHFAQMKSDAGLSVRLWPFFAFSPLIVGQMLIQAWRDFSPLLTSRMIVWRIQHTMILCWCLRPSNLLYQSLCNIVWVYLWVIFLEPALFMRDSSIINHHIFTWDQKPVQVFLL